MPDQAQPDYGQNPQFAPGFQPQTPIPGIQSSYPQQQAYNFPTNQAVAQQADAIVYQSTSNAKMTMALAQQNLMSSMHNAMLGSITAFSDVSRRGGSMITAMAPAGHYNDMLAPNQNWALESSARREIGYGVGNFLGLDPRNSVMSRLIQGRRPEFLTEGEYGATMGYATQLRMANLETAAKSVGVSTAVGIAAGYLAPIPGIGAMVLGGLAIDRTFEAMDAPRKEVIRQQMLYRNKRVGIGQQYITGEATADVTNALYSQENPFAARFFGDNAIGNAFKPEVQKMKLFGQATEAGLFSFEKLDSDSIIKRITEISDTVEKFSRIGKVTREVAVKLMGDLKGAGVQGDKLQADFSHAAIMSSVTGIDLQSMVGMKAQAARQGSYQGYDTYSASQTYENTLSGFAMMQSSGLFRQQDIMQLTKTAYEHNTAGGPRDIKDMMYRFGGIGGATEKLAGMGGGNAAVGYANMALGKWTVVNRIHGAVDKAVKNGAKTWAKVLQDAEMSQMQEEYKQTGDGTAIQLAYNYYLGLETASQDQVEKSFLRQSGIDVPAPTSITDIGYGARASSATMKLFSGPSTTESISTGLGTFVPNEYGTTGSMTPMDDLMKSAAFQKAGNRLNTEFSSKVTNITEANKLTDALQTIMPIGPDGKLLNKEQAAAAMGIFGTDKLNDREMRNVFLQKMNPTLFKQAADVVGNDLTDKSQLGVLVAQLDKRGFKGDTSDTTAKEIYSTLKTSGNVQGIGATFASVWSKGSYGSYKNQKLGMERYSEAMREELRAKGIDPKVLEGLDASQIPSVLKLLSEGEYNSQARSREVVESEASRLGMTTEAYTKGFSSLIPFAAKYFKSGKLGAEYVDNSESGGGFVKEEARMALKKSLTSLDANGQKIVRDAFKDQPDSFEHILKELDTKTMPEASFNVIATKLSEIDKGSSDTQHQIYVDALKASVDPAGAAVDTLNTLLKQVLGAMNGTPTTAATATPVQTHQSRENKNVVSSGFMELRRDER